MYTRHPYARWPAATGIWTNELNDTMPEEAMMTPAAAPHEIATDLATRFHNLVAEWKAARGHVSSINAWARLPAYQAIIALGPEVIPLLLKELESSPDHWFWALKELTGENPVTPDSRGNISEMAKCWLAWGKNKGYQW